MLYNQFAYYWRAEAHFTLVDAKICPSVYHLDQTKRTYPTLLGIGRTDGRGDVALLPRSHTRCSRAKSKGDVNPGVCEESKGCRYAAFGITRSFSSVQFTRETPLTTKLLARGWFIAGKELCASTDRNVFALPVRQHNHTHTFTGQAEGPQSQVHRHRTQLIKTVNTGDMEVIYNTNAQYREIQVCYLLDATRRECQRAALGLDLRADVP
eukprot:5763171-Pyramimonas_sp.AAC.2